MNSVVFRPSPIALFYTSVFVAGLLVFVWLHWRGGRQTEFYVFAVLAALAATLYTLRGSVSVEASKRELTARKTWLGMAYSTAVVRVDAEGKLYLNEELKAKQSQGTSVWQVLEADGRVLSETAEGPGPYPLMQQQWVKNRHKLAEFAEHASRILRVPLEDNRTYKKGSYGE